MKKVYKQVRSNGMEARLRIQKETKYVSLRVLFENIARDFLFLAHYTEIPILTSCIC